MTLSTQQQERPGPGALQRQQEVGRTRGAAGGRPGGNRTYHERPDTLLAGGNCRPDRGLGCSRWRRGAASHTQNIAEYLPLFPRVPRANPVG